MFELTFYNGETAIDWTDKVISLGRLQRKTEEEGRIPRTLYFDNFDIEIPLHQTGGLFDLNVLSAYPEYHIRLRLLDKTVFAGMVDFESIRFTGADTVQLQAVSFLGGLDRKRWPEAFPETDLVEQWGQQPAEWLNVTAGGTTAIADFYQYLYIRRVPASGWVGDQNIFWSAHSPLRLGDFFIHPDLPDFVYQVRSHSVITDVNGIHWHRYELDRNFFWPNPTIGNTKQYETLPYKKREFLDTDIFDYFTPPGFSESLLWVNGRKLGEALFPELPAGSIDSLFLGDGPVFASIDLDVATVIAREDNPIKILFMLLGFQRQILVQDATGVLKTIPLSNIEASPDDPFPELPLETELDRGLDFTWDKRVDKVKITASWRGDTVEVIHEREQTGSADARQTTLNIEAVGDAARANQIAAEWFSLYNPRRLQAKVSYPCNTMLDYDPPVHILELDLYSHVRYRDRGWWISGMEIDIINMSITLELTGLEAFLTQDWS